MIYVKDLSKLSSVAGGPQCILLLKCENIVEICTTRFGGAPYNVVGPEESYT